MNFPDFDVWCKEVLHPKDCGGGIWTFNTKEWHDHYLKKHRIVKAFGAKSILEIGIRYGYSAHAFLTAGGTLYTGVDSDDPKHNTMGEPTCDWATKMLEKTVPNGKVTILKMDTQIAVPVLPPESFDFVHIDADHSYHGCLHDMVTFWPACRHAMLVDDYDTTGSVRDAIAEFIRQTGTMMFNAKSMNGEALLIK